MYSTTVPARSTASSIQYSTIRAQSLPATRFVTDEMVARHASRALIQSVPSTRSSTYICRQCRQHLTTRSTSIQTRKFTSTSSRDDFEREKPLTTLEKVRKKLWKGEAPGPKDIDEVYGGKGAIAEMREERKAKDRGEKIASVVEDQLFEDQSEAIDGELSTQQDKDIMVIPSLQDYEGHRAIMPGHDSDAAPIENWDDLEVIGHRGDWKEMPVLEADEYTPWMHAQKAPGLTYIELIPILKNCMVSLKLVQASIRDREILSRAVDFQDRKVTLEILRELSRATSFRISDPVLNQFRHNPSTNTYGDLLIILAEEMRPKAATVTEKLAENHALSSAANLMIANRRETAVDKDKELGRWKLIQRELESRGLTQSSTEATP